MDPSSTKTFIEMEKHPLVCYGDHQSLTNALSSHDIETFRRALHSPTEVEKYELETSMTIFEKACQMPDCSQFIEECILAGCDVNKLNAELNKRPINFVVESHCIDNLAALLRDPGVVVNSKNAMFKTPVNFLTEQITDDNFRRLFPCIKLLIQHGADVNLPDKRETTPIINVLKSRNLSTVNKEIIVRYLLQNVVEVDIDSYRNGEARVLLQNLFPEIELMPNVLLKNSIHNLSKNDRQWDFNSLYLLLKNEKEDEFLHGLEQIAGQNSHTLQELFSAAENRETLLIVAIGKDLTMAVERMIQLGVDVNFFTEETRDTLTPLKCACIRGHWKTLEILIKAPALDINASPLLPIIVKNFGHYQSKHVDYEKCFDILLQHRNIDIDQMDVNDCSALHYAVRFNHSTAIIELLKRGAYIGVQDKFKKLAISDIRSKVLEKHFDSCISSNSCRMSDDNFEIGFDFKNLIPVQHAYSDSVTDELTAIEYISKSNELKQLMMHPLIASFLSLKWNRLALFFYINFFLCAVFAVITVSYILLYYNYDEPSTIKDFMRIIMFLLTIYIAVREMYQFTFSPCAYLKGLENYLECSLVVLIMLILFDVCSDDWRRIFAAASILLISIEIFLLAGSLPFWSFCTHFVMLKTVTWSFLKSFSLYSIIFLAFALSFFTLLHEPLKEKSTREKGKTTGDDSDEDEGDFNKFTNLGLSIMKTSVMSTGEFDVASINFKTNAFSYFVFITFLFLVSIVLLSLLQGLAVSDTQNIKSEAELIYFIRRSQVLVRYKTVLSASCPTFIKLFPFCARIGAFKETKSICHIRVKPNQNNLILIPDVNSQEEESDVEENLTALHSLVHHRCARMDAKIVKLALQVLERNANEKHDAKHDEKEQFMKRFNQMEATLDRIENKLNDLSNN